MGWRVEVVLDLKEEYSLEREVSSFSIRAIVALSREEEESYPSTFCSNVIMVLSIHWI